MDLRYVRSFLVLSETLHFRRTAELVHLSQPALSLQIRNLEDELGVQLFQRDRRSTTLTPSGRIFVDQAREMLRIADRAQTMLRKASAGGLGTLRIGFISTAAALLIPPLVLEFRKSFPGVEFELRNILTSDQVSQLVDKRIDVGFVRLPMTPPPGIHLEVVHREPFILLLPRLHPLAKKKRLLMEHLKGADFVMYTRRMAPSFHDRILTELHQRGITPHIVQEAGEMFTLLSLVSAGFGIAIAPESILLHTPSGVVTRSLPKDFPASEIALASNEANLSKPADLFCGMVRSWSRQKLHEKKRSIAIKHGGYVVEPEWENE